jgi:hypothetical protein
MEKKNLENKVIELIDVPYDDGTILFMTQEDYDRLYTIQDLQNTLGSIGNFLFQHRGLVFSAISFASGFLSFKSSTFASTRDYVQTHVDTEILNQPFDPEKSFQHFLERTGNVQKGFKPRPFGKTHRLGSAFEYQSFSPKPVQKNFFTLANFLSYANTLRNEGILAQTSPILWQAHNAYQGGKLLLSLRGGFTALLSPTFLLSFIFSILGLIDLIRKTKKTMDTILWTMKTHPHALPETVTAPFGITRKRTWREYFKTYIDFRTPKPYILLVSGGIIFFTYRNGSGILTFLKEKQPMTVIFEGIFGIAHKQFDDYKEIAKKTDEVNENFIEKFINKALNELDISNLKFNKINQKLSNVIEKNAQCPNSLAISELTHSFCASKANEYGTQNFLLELEKNQLQKVHYTMVNLIKDVASKLHSHASKALTIPGQTQYLESIVKEANKKIEEFAHNVPNTKIPEAFYFDILEPLFLIYQRGGN